MRTHVKLEIRLFGMNFNSGGFPLRILYCVVDTGYVGLADLLGISDLHCQKVESNKWLKNKLGGFLFLLRLAGGWLEFIMQAFGFSLKLSSSR